MNTRRVRRSRWLIRYTLRRLRFTISINYQIINSTIRITLEYWYSFVSPPLFLNFYRIPFFFYSFVISARSCKLHYALLFLNSHICSHVKPETRRANKRGRINNLFLECEWPVLPPRSRSLKQVIHPHFVCARSVTGFNLFPFALHSLSSTLFPHVQSFLATCQPGFKPSVIKLEWTISMSANDIVNINIQASCSLAVCSRSFTRSGFAFVRTHTCTF